MGQVISQGESNGILILRSSSLLVYLVDEWVG
jgi:hypothetical protein